MLEDNGLILLIEDEAQMRRFLRILLYGHGYRLIESDTGGEGLQQAVTRHPDIVLLDLGLPDMDGIEVAKKLRECSEMPIIVISAREKEEDKIKALEAGADDYLTKPFGAGELIARIRVALRHRAMFQSGQKELEFTLGDLRVDFAKRRVFLKSGEIHLTSIEYRLLTVLIKNVDKVVPNIRLLEEVWGPSYTGPTVYVRVYMAQLRRKLEEDPAQPKFLINEPGIGYRLKVGVR